MANHKSAKKRIRTNARKNAVNKASVSKMKTLVKKVSSLTKPEEGDVSYKEAVAVLDRMASKGRVHKNTVARKKSALTKHINKLAAKDAPKA